MIGIEAAPDPIEFAKELALEFELSGGGDEASISSTLQLMNSYLHANSFDGQSIVKADEAYKLPDSELDLEFLPESMIDQLRVAGVIVKGNISEIKWFGSVTLTAFGVRMYGVDFYQPEHRSTETLFIPVENIALRIAA